MLRLALIAPVALTALVLLLAAGAGAEPEAPAFDVPEGPPIQLDGVVNPAEWEGAHTCPLGDTGARMRIRQHRGMLLIGFEAPLGWPDNGSLLLYASPDVEGAGMRASGFVSIDYEPARHDRAHVIVRRTGPEGSRRVHDAVVARSVLTQHGAQIEMAFRLDLLGLTTEDRTRRLAAYWIRPYSRRHASWPAGLNFVSKPGQLPPDLASAARWGSLRALGDPKGPGAFPKSEWTKWIEHDRELTRRGTEAHAEVNLLVEEWKKTKKRDAELEERVFENFAWIAKHERLVPLDLLATVKTLRYLNRGAQALGILEALVNHRDRAVRRAALFERAQTLTSLDRYAKAAADWSALADQIPQYAGIYRQKASRALDKAEAYEAERRADAADPGRHERPLVGLYTEHGLVVLELFANEVPNAVEHFLNLVESKFYDGTLFHRVQGDFLAQGGDPKSRDQGCEFAGRGTSETQVPMERNERRGFWRGTVGFARRDRPVNGSQFFILTSPQLDFSDPGKEGDRGYTCFGRVLSGMDVADRIAYCDKLIKAVVLRR